MIAIKLTSGLGNNMFQYAAARSIAQRRGFGFCYFPIRNPQFYWRKLRKEVAQWRGRGSDKRPKQIAQADICRYFTLGGEGAAARWFRRLFWVTRGGAKAYFSPERKAFADKVPYEIFDERAFAVADRTELSGAFQTGAYFEANRDQVIDWFKLTPRYRAELEALERSFPVPLERRCCIHVRRGDQLDQDKGLAWKNLGWTMPIEYYKAAIASLPPDLFYVVATDSPDYVRQEFGFLENMHVCDGNTEAVDMMLFTRCKFNIVANSTFSWWGAWLNEIAGRRVIAPKYHLGWSRRTWVPWSFDRHPQDWTYIDVLDVLGADAPDEKTAAIA